VGAGHLRQSVGDKTEHGRTFVGFTTLAGEKSGGGRKEQGTKVDVGTAVSLWLGSDASGEADDASLQITCSCLADLRHATRKRVLCRVPETPPLHAYHLDYQLWTCCLFVRFESIGRMYSLLPRATSTMFGNVRHASLHGYPGLFESVERHVHHTAILQALLDLQQQQGPRPSSFALYGYLTS
jgi:hypothetical protein